LIAGHFQSVPGATGTVYRLLHDPFTAGTHRVRQASDGPNLSGNPEWGKDTVPEPADTEDAREQQFWATTLRLLWTCLALLVVVGVLLSLTMLLGWLPYLLLSLLGLFTGIAITVAVLGSARARLLISLVLGAVTFPLLAAYFGGLAVSNPGAFSAYSASFFPFLAHAAGAMVAGVWIWRIWHAGSERPSALAEGAPGPSPGGLS
jgi:hypothetical protein